MAKINFDTGVRLRHARSTITFDGTAGNGDAGTVIVFTVTGRVLVTHLTAFCTALLATTGAATMVLGTANRTSKFIASTTATDIDQDEWWVDGTPLSDSVNVVHQTTNGSDPSQMNVVVSSNIILTIASADISSGTLVFDAWYYPVTDNGNLS